MFHDQRLWEPTTPMLGKCKLGSKCSGIWTAILSIVAIATVLGASPASADEQANSAAISYQVSDKGEISVVYGPGHKSVIPQEDLYDIPITLKVPQDVLDAIKDGGELDYVIFVKKKGGEFALRRCHRHVGGFFHCH